MEKKTVLVVSGNGVTGSKILEKLSSEYRVLVTYNNNDLEIENIKSNNPGRDIESVKVDITDSDQVRRLADHAKSKYGGIYAIINCAAKAATGTLIDTSEEVWDSIINTNLKGTFLICKYMLPLMIPQNEGRIINFSSLHGKNTPALRAAFGASKHGVVGLTQSLACEAAKYNICVNAISPGPVESSKLRESWAKTEARLGMESGYVERKKLGQIPLGRMCKSEDIASLVAFLLSDCAKDISGSVIDVTGGAVANE